MGLFSKKKDFWDAIDDEVENLSAANPQTQSNMPPIEHADALESSGQYDTSALPTGAAAAEQFEEAAVYDDDVPWSIMRATPFKMMMRLLLMVSVIVLAVSGYMIFGHLGAGNGSDTDAYFKSSNFSQSYDKSVTQLIHLIQAIESENGSASSDTQNGGTTVDSSLVENYMGKEGNFVYAVYDTKNSLIVSSGTDAVTRIESSSHYLKISSEEGKFATKISVPQAALDLSGWETELLSCDNQYVIYTAVDNTLTVQDAFYDSYQEYQKFDSYYGIARIAIIAAGIVFLIALIFCVISTGLRQHEAEIHLSWFDKIVTEIALILIVAFSGAAVYGAYHFNNYSSDMNVALFAGCAALAYIFIIRGYFSIVRRIKAGTFTYNSIIGICLRAVGRGLAKLPGFLRVLVILILLVGINGGLIYCLIYQRDIMAAGIPVIYIVAPIVFVIENICFISWIVNRNSDDDEAEELTSTEEPSHAELESTVSDLKETYVPADDFVTEVGSIPEEIVPQQTPEAEVPAVPEEVPEAQNAAQAAAAEAKEAPAETAAMLDKPGSATVSLSADEINQRLEASFATDNITTIEKTPLIQMNKNIRKEYKERLKASSVSVALRAPSTEIELDIRPEKMTQVITTIFENVLTFAAAETKAYAEMYRQDGNIIYIVKMTVKDGEAEHAKALMTELTDALATAKETIEQAKGKFVVNFDGTELKIGILLTK